ncbi:MAG: hypothetical protein M1820_007798 [Bogoriella megaspora]|nr:MAG: hypothetical protein M1820_007798 [Bogoriella megaspora]
MALPEAVALLFSLLGLYNTLRNGMQQLYVDVHTGKRWKRDCIRIIQRVDDVQNDMENNFREFWLLWNRDMSDKLHKWFWGEDGYENVQKQLQQMQEDANDIQKHLKGFNSTAEKKTQLANKEQSTLVRFRRAAMSAKSSVAGLRYVILQKNYLNDVVTTMEKAKETLKSTAVTAYRTKHGLSKTGIERERIQNLGLHRLLKEFVLERREELKLLGESLEPLNDANSPPYTIELELDSFDLDDMEARRHDKHRVYKKRSIIHESAATRILKVNLLVGSSQDPLMRVFVQKSSRTTEDKKHTNARAAITNLFDSTARQTSYSADLTTSFIITKSSDMHDRNVGKRIAFRELLQITLSHQSSSKEAQQRSRALERQPELLEDYQKYKSIVELTQACFVFIPTSWLCNLCSCRLQCGPIQNTGNGSYELSLNIGSCKHVRFNLGRDESARAIPAEDRINGGQEDLPIWCQNQALWNRVLSPVRRLGIVIVELTLDVHVQTAVMQGDAIERLRLIPPTEGDDIDLHQLQSRLELETRDQSYAKAVRALLDWQSEGNISDILNFLYWDVLVPIKGYFVEVEDKHKRRRQEIDC